MYWRNPLSAVIMLRKMTGDEARPLIIQRQVPGILADSLYQWRLALVEAFFCPSQRTKTMTIRYCPHCWAENSYQATSCLVCSAFLVEKGKGFVEMLLDAIAHPEPTRAAIAIEVVGCRLREVRAVDSLLARLVRRPDSMDVTSIAAEALGIIGEPRAIPALAELLLDRTRPLPTRLAAAEALAKFDDPMAWVAFSSALALPEMPRLLRRIVETALAARGERQALTEQA